jgi:hypothetical protein
MTEAGLEEIEAALGVTLPLRYRDFMKNYPFAAESWAADLAMPDDVMLVIDLNEEARARTSPALPDETFVVGSDGGGLEYFVHLADSRCAVHSLSLDTGASRQEAADFALWVEKLKAAESSA